MSDSNGRVHLEAACLDDGIDVWSMIQEIGPGENGFHNSGFGVPFSRFREFLQTLVDMERGVGLPPGWVPQTTYWAYAGSRPVGTIKIRHYLTDALRATGGHIGYSIRPSARGRGYGTRMLRASLREGCRLGIEAALITVNEDNQASWRMVESVGGRLDRIEDGKRYYYVATGADQTV